MGLPASLAIPSFAAYSCSLHFGGALTPLFLSALEFESPAQEPPLGKLGGGERSDFYIYKNLVLKSYLFQILSWICHCHSLAPAMP